MYPHRPVPKDASDHFVVTPKEVASQGSCKVLIAGYKKYFYTVSIAKTLTITWSIFNNGYVGISLGKKVALRPQL